MPHDHHHHGHHHHHVDESTSTTRLFITMMLNFVITIVEVIGGILSGSLSLLSDALHNFSDGIAIIISYIAIRLGKQPQTAKYTFGLKRAEIIAAVFNAGTLIVICFYLFKESYHRFTSPEEISGGLMIAVASIGLVANVVGTMLLKKGSKDNINIRAAYLHLLSDAISSVAVIIGGLCIYYFQVYWVDPLLTVLISVYILVKSLEIVKEAINVLMMGSPESISIENIQKDIEELPGIINIHHVHIWRLNERMVHFEAHVDVEDMQVSQTTELSDMIEERLKTHHNINHVTLQFEADKCSSKDLLKG
ncbi:MAG: cation transporter [bacterium]|nr:cation transporter [bacterium]